MRKKLHINYWWIKLKLGHSMIHHIFDKEENNIESEAYIIDLLLYFVSVNQFNLNSLNLNFHIFFVFKSWLTGSNQCSNITTDILNLQ